MSRGNQLEANLRISQDDLSAVNALLTDPDNPLISRLLDIIESYGGVSEANRRAAEAGQLESRLERLGAAHSPYLDDLDWLRQQRDERAFVSLADYRKTILGAGDGDLAFDEAHAVTLEISDLSFFPWLISEARQAVERRELMPARYVRVGSIAQQAGQQGDLDAVAAAIQLMGGSLVHALDTRGTDGSNVMLGGPETLSGYFGGIGQPNEYPFKWADEYLRYYTEYGIRQVLNVNAGTVLVALLLYKLGIDNEFKVSVFMGVDNPFAAMWLLMATRLLARDDGSSSLAGLNLSNSVNGETIIASAQVRAALGMESAVRFEHHVTEASRSIVRQPYDRLAEIVEVASRVQNMSAKHDGGEPSIEAKREHPSDIMDYFRSREEIEARGLMSTLERNYLDKHDAVNRTSAALTKAGIGVHAAPLLHLCDVTAA